MHSFSICLGTSTSAGMSIRNHSILKSGTSASPSIRPIVVRYHRNTVLPSTRVPVRTMLLPVRESGRRPRLAAVVPKAVEDPVQGGRSDLARDSGGALRFWRSIRVLIYAVF